MSERPMFYVAEAPQQPGCAFASCVDDPQYAKYTAKSIAGWVRRGGIIKRVDGDTMVRMLNDWKRPNEQRKLL